MIYGHRSLKSSNIFQKNTERHTSTNLWACWGMNWVVSNSGLWLMLLPCASKKWRRSHLSVAWTWLFTVLRYLKKYLTDYYFTAKLTEKGLQLLYTVVNTDFTSCNVNKQTVATTTKTRARHHENTPDPKEIWFLEWPHCINSWFPVL